MAEAIATGLAVEAAKAATKLVTARVLDEITLACGFQDQLVKLHDKFSNIQALLEDLGSAKYVEKSRFVNLWLKKFTDLAYSADELMDDYEYELLRRKIELKNNHPSFKKKCSNFFSTATNPAVFRIRMSHRVREILSKFDELHKEANNNGIQLGQLAREAVASTSVGCHVDNEALLHQNRKHAVARGSEFIGRKSDEEKLLQMILNPTHEDTDRLSTVAIVGIGGLGKTTIARRLYDHENVSAHFGKKIWICVSEDFKVDRLLNEMIENLTSSKCDLSNTGAITNKLQELLKGTNLFLVLDDVWEDNQESWNSFKNALLSIGDLRGCVILITTRSNDVAEKARAFYQHKLPGLSEDEGWALLQQRVFSETRPYDSSFDNVGRRIVNNKCKGVPLAIKAIGGTLQLKKHAYEWELIENSGLWKCQPGDINDILPSLMLSYNYLNHVYIKQCFAYCAVFPKDYQMKKNQLITMWLAQGFLHDEFATGSSTLTMEMIGERYFDILLNFSFLEEEKDFLDRIVYKMHDLVHDLAAYVSTKYMLVWKDGIKVEHDVSDVRRLGLTSSETSTRRLSTRKLRTIFFWGHPQEIVVSWDSVWIGSTLGFPQYMRTLIIAHTFLKEVPCIIGQLVHLRYLDLSDSEIEALPESICKLYQLQTLRIVNCPVLKELPRELHRLRSLRHIETGDYYYVSASTGLRQLINLQTLPSLKLCDGERWSIDELGPLDQVKGKLNIRGLEHVKNKETARQAGLGRKDKIVKLDLFWDASHQENNDEDVLDSLEPHPYLESLVVRGFMGVRFPPWIMTMAVKHGGHPAPLTNLKEVRLRDCCKIKQLPTLGQLPFLRILWLEGFNDVQCIGEEFYNVDGTADEKVLFGSLSELHIISFPRLTTWMPPALPIQAEMLFPKIETLVIERCPKMERVPCLQFQYVEDLTLENTMIIPSCLMSLKKLSIWECPSLACIPDGLSSLRGGLQKCPLMKDPIPDIGRLQKLEELRLVNSGELLTCCLQWIPNLHRLKILEIGGDSRDEWDFNLTFPQSLRELTLIDFPNVKSLPHQQFLPCTLESLRIVRFDELEQLPEWIGNLSSLHRLTLKNCKKLKYLPSQQAMLNLCRLQHLLIDGCGHLTRRYGPEWQKISHIPRILILRSYF